MRLARHRQFVRHFQKRILPFPKLVARFKQRLKLLLTEPDNPLLNDHPLKGRGKEYPSFSVTGDIRVVYKIKNDTLQLYDIGTHNQVY